MSKATNLIKRLNEAMMKFDKTLDYDNHLTVVENKNRGPEANSTWYAVIFNDDPSKTEYPVFKSPSKNGTVRFYVEKDGEVIDVSSAMQFAMYNNKD